MLQAPYRAAEDLRLAAVARGAVDRAGAAPHGGIAIAHDLLANEPLIRYDRNQWGGRQADEYLRKVGIVPRERFELNALNAIAVMVDRGLGVSLVPDWARPWPEGLKLARAAAAASSRCRAASASIWSRASVRAAAGDACCCRKAVQSADNAE